MALFKKNKSETEKLYGASSDLLEARFSKMPTEDLFIMVETSLSEAGASFVALRNASDPGEKAAFHSILDAHLGAAVTGMRVMHGRESDPDTYR